MQRLTVCVHGISGVHEETPVAGLDKLGKKRIGWFDILDAAQAHLLAQATL